MPGFYSCSVLLAIREWERKRDEGLMRSELNLLFGFPTGKGKSNVTQNSQGSAKSQVGNST